MVNTDPHSWPHLLWDVVQWAFVATGTTASTVVLWLAAHYRLHVEMLYKHDDHLTRHAEQLDEHAQTILAADQSNAKEHRRLHQRINHRRDEHARTREAIVEIQNDMKWVRRYLEQNGSE